jgi:hypothetical protein
MKINGDRTQKALLKIFEFDRKLNSEIFYFGLYESVMFFYNHINATPTNF